jgi:diguanylate cyclase (GGDEF)-like protein
MAAISWQILSAQSGPTKAALRFDRSRHLLRLALPYLAIALDTILVVIAVNRNELIDWRTPGLLNGLLFLTSLVLLRQFMVLRANTNLYEEMKRLASTDSLTELYNRHFFNEVFPLEIERARRYDKPLAILLMDIDGFKAINDHLGHLRGDEVLKVVARSLANQLRAADLIARFGGDEFIVILPETSKEEASVVADRLKQAVARQKVGEFPLGITIGAASFHPDISPKALLEEADRDLYRQKLLPSTQTP